MLLSEMDIFFSEKDEFYRSVHSVASLKILKGRTNFFLRGVTMEHTTRPPTIESPFLSSDSRTNVCRNSAFNCRTTQGGQCERRRSLLWWCWLSLTHLMRCDFLKGVQRCCLSAFLVILLPLRSIHLLGTSSVMSLCKQELSDSENRCCDNSETLLNWNASVYTFSWQLNARR